jgi:hypothetical protein
VYLYTNALLGHLSFLLNKKGPKTLAEAHNMAMRIEVNLSLSKGKHFSSLWTKINEDTSDTLSLKKLVSLEAFTADSQERREQVFNQQNEDMVEELEPEQIDEVSTCAPPSDKAIHEPFLPAQQQDDEVSCFPFQDVDDTLFHDSESEGGMESLKEVDLPCCTIEDEEAVHEDETITHVENNQVLKAPAQEETISYPPPQDFDDALLYDRGDKEEINESLKTSNPACYDTDSDMVDNIDEFIHVGRRRWDVVGYDLDPIYDIESHFQVFPLQLSQQVTLDQWQQGDEIFTHTFQTLKDDLVPCFPDDFQSSLEGFDEYSFEHLDSFHEDDYQPPLCSGLHRSKDLLCLKKDPCHYSPQPPPITLLCCVSRGVVGKYVFDFEFPLGQTLESKGWLNTTSLSLLSQFFDFPLKVFQSSIRSLSIPPRALDFGNVLGSQLADLLSQFSEPLTFHDPFLKWIEHFPQRLTWHDFIPPTRRHELDFMVFDDMIHFLTHVIFVLNLSLFWFMMKHKGRYGGALLDWFHWSFDYT